METSEHVMNSGKIVRIYDDCLPVRVRNQLYSMATKASFTIGWEDTRIIENQSHKYLHAVYTGEDINKFGFFLYLAKTPTFKELNDKQIVKIVLNLSTSSDVNFPHIHPDQTVLLYYANLHWEANWFGETLFFDDDLKAISLALPYTPGRIVVFDGEIPHSIRPQSHLAPFFRFTFAAFFIKERPTAPIVSG